VRASPDCDLSGIFLPRREYLILLPYSIPMFCRTPGISLEECLVGASIGGRLLGWVAFRATNISFWHQLAKFRYRAQFWVSWILDATFVSNALDFMVRFVGLRCLDLFIRTNQGKCEIAREVRKPLGSRGATIAVECFQCQRWVLRCRLTYSDWCWLRATSAGAPLSRGRGLG
jgi:hypothetical protein